MRNSKLGKSLLSVGLSFALVLSAPMVSQAGNKTENGKEQSEVQVAAQQEKPKLNKTKISLYDNGTTTLKVSGTSRKPKFTSSKKSVATVSNSGKVTARKPGTAVITAKAGSKKLTCKVTVKAEKPKLNKTKISLYDNGTTTLKVSGTSRKPKFTSSKKSVATVSSSGKVTARKPGTATITARAGSKKLTCKVTVKKESPKLSKSKISLHTNGKTTLKVSGTSRKPKFTSSKKSVATVSSSGKITARKSGTAAITVRIGSKKLTCKVTVKKGHDWKPQYKKVRHKPITKKYPVYDEQYVCNQCGKRFGHDGVAVAKHVASTPCVNYSVKKVKVGTETVVIKKGYTSRDFVYNKCAVCGKRDR